MPEIGTEPQGRLPHTWNILVFFSFCFEVIDLSVIIVWSWHLYKKRHLWTSKQKTNLLCPQAQVTCSCAQSHCCGSESKIFVVVITAGTTKTAAKIWHCALNSGNKQYMYRRRRGKRFEIMVLQRKLALALGLHSSGAFSSVLDQQALLQIRRGTHKLRGIFHNASLKNKSDISAQFDSIHMVWFWTKNVEKVSSHFPCPERHWSELNSEKWDFLFNQKGLFVNVVHALFNKRNEWNVWFFTHGLTTWLKIIFSSPEEWMPHLVEDRHSTLVARRHHHDGLCDAVHVLPRHTDGYASAVGYRCRYGTVGRSVCAKSSGACMQE